MPKGGLEAFHTLTKEELTQVDADGFLNLAGGYYAPHGCVLPVADCEALLGKRGAHFNRHVERLIDVCLRSQDAFLALD